MVTKHHLFIQKVVFCCLMPLDRFLHVFKLISYFHMYWWMMFGWMTDVSQTATALSQGYKLCPNFKIER